MAKHWKLFLFGGLALMFIMGGSTDLYFQFGILVFVVPLILVALGLIFMFQNSRHRLAEEERKAAEAKAAWEAQQREAARLKAEQEASAAADRAEREKRHAEWQAQFEARKAARAAKEADAVARRAGTVEEEFPGVGVMRWQKVFRKHGEEDPDYRLSKQELAESGITYDVFQYSFDDVSFSLEREPDNEHDPNAVKILMNGDMIGYIPSDDAPHVAHLIDNDLIVDIDGYVVGGPLLRYDPLDDTFEKVPLYFGVRILIYVHPEDAA